MPPQIDLSGLPDNLDLSKLPDNNEGDGWWNHFHKIKDNLKGKIDDFLLNHLDELAQKKSGILNPNPEQNPVLGKSFLPETQADPGIFGAIKHTGYEALRSMASPLGIYGGFMAPDISTEPIGVPRLSQSGRPIDINLGGEYPRPPQRLQLPPAPPELPQTKFYQGPAGTTEAGMTYPMDIGPTSPRLGQKDAGTILPRETEGINRIPAIDAAKRGTSFGDIAPISEEDRLLRNVGKLSQELQPNLGLSNLPKLVGKNVDGSDIHLQFEGTTVTPEQVKSMFPGENIQVIPFSKKGSIRPDQSRFKITVSDTNGNLSSKEATRLGDQIGENFSEWSDKSKQYQLPTAIKDISNRLESNPQIANRDVSKPSIDIVNSTPTRPTIPTDIVLPKPGQIKPQRDISAYQADFNSPHKVLSRNEQTAPGIEALLNANDEGTKWIRSTLQELEEYSKGLNKEQRIELFKALNGEKVTNSDIITRANGARQVLNSIFDQIPDFKGKGYLEDYITHIEKQPDDIKAAIKTIFDWEGLGSIFKKGELEKPSGTIGDNLYEKALGDPSSPYIKRRTGALTDIETDYNRIVPIYVQSMKKLIFDKPAVDSAKKVLETLPESKLKELFAWTIKNYTNYDAEQGLHKAWQSFASTIANTNSRNFIALNPGVHMLHLGQIPANIYPELGEKFTTMGLLDILKRPVKTYGEMANLGLLQNEVKPWAFRTASERLNSLGYYMSYVESLVKGTAYNGMKRKLLAQGLDESTAQIQALRFAKDSTMTTDAVRKMKGFSPESNFIGGEWGSKLPMQYKQIPMKIVEQYMDIARNAKQNPKAAARMMAGAGLAAALSAEGLHTFHVSLPSLARISGFGPLGDTGYKVYQALMGGDWQKALIETSWYVTPGGATIRKGLNEINPDEVKPPRKLKFIS